MMKVYAEFVPPRSLAPALGSADSASRLTKTRYPRPPQGATLRAYPPVPPVQGRPMRTPRRLLALLALLVPATARAGLYYSGEPVAELPSQWRGFLLDQRALRMIAVPPKGAVPASPMRQRCR